MLFCFSPGAPDIKKLCDPGDQSRDEGRGPGEWTSLSSDAGPLPLTPCKDLDKILKL